MVLSQSTDEAVCVPKEGMGNDARLRVLNEVRRSGDRDGRGSHGHPSEDMVPEHCESCGSDSVRTLGHCKTQCMRCGYFQGCSEGT